ncbi:hypothetical protein GCM10022255_075950 [Dactylosporangium darangshiense]|uniref:Uncharacterized protein n=1 Tax=Dactylosporangium darangshiense TaxID=579108 RepID=A0ABP8DK60_9ACTN
MTRVDPAAADGLNPRSCHDDPTAGIPAAGGSARRRAGGSIGALRPLWLDIALVRTGLARAGVGRERLGLLSSDGRRRGWHRFGR